MTRAQLAVAIAKNFSYFLEVSQPRFLLLAFRVNIFMTEIAHGSRQTF